MPAVYTFLIRVLGFEKLYLTAIIKLPSTLLFKNEFYRALISCFLLVYVAI